MAEIEYGIQFSLDNRVYIVTGGTGHLGREVCKALASHGATVYCLARDKSKMAAFESFLKGNPKGKIIFIRADVTNEGDVESSVSTILNNEGNIDGLFNNAQSSLRGINIEMSMDDWDDGLSKVISHYFLFSRIVLRHMEKQGGGVIINNSSLWGLVSPDPRAYLDLKNEPPLFFPPAKAGIIQLTKYLAVLYAKKGIRINTITPGFFPQKRGPERLDYMEQLTSRIPMGRIGHPSEVTGVVCFLFSDASSYITGQNLVIDGGYTLW